MSKPKTPVGSFGPEVFAALIEGSRRTIKCELSYRNAVAMRQRMHRLRAQMREDAHPLYDMTMKTQVRIEYKPTTALKTNARGAKTPIDTEEIVTLVIAPRDTTFTDALIKAGITIRRLEDLLPPPDPKEPEHKPPIDIDDILKDKP